jgi:hypothetical protein
MDMKLVYVTLFLIIVGIDYKSDFLKVKKYKKIKTNKVVLFFIILLLSLTIIYINDYIIYNYYDDQWKLSMEDRTSGCDYSLEDSMQAGLLEELLFRLLVFNIILLKVFKLNVTTSIIISSLLFGLIHITHYIYFGESISKTVITIIQAIFAGFLLPFLYANTNLSTVILLHFLTDYINFNLLRCNIQTYKKMLFIE